MKERVLSGHLSQHIGQPVHLVGWVHRIRDIGSIRFLVLRDRVGLVQVVVRKSIECGDVTCESVVDIVGICRADERAPAGVEIDAQSVTLISHAETPPVTVSQPEAEDTNRLETLLNHRAVGLRIPGVLEVFRVQACILRAFRSFLHSQGFTEITTPKLVETGAEGGSAVFPVEYFGRRASLAQSPQFYKQIMVGSGLERVFEVGHAYRAERSETNRHLTEYVSLDFEMGFIESVEDVMDMHEALIWHIFEAVGGECRPILERRGVMLPKRSRVPRISYEQATEVLARHFAKTEGLNGDLDTEAEKLISQWALEEFGSELIFVTGYHISKRPMYTMPDVKAQPATCSFDLLFRGVEITTGGQRIHNYAQLMRSMESHLLDPNAFADYLAAFKHGMPTHGGMGMGLERLTKQMLGLANVKEASLFPRDCGRLTP